MKIFAISTFTWQARSISRWRRAALVESCGAHRNELERNQVRMTLHRRRYFMSQLEMRPKAFVDHDSPV